MPAAGSGGGVVVLQITVFISDFADSKSVFFLKIDRYNVILNCSMREE